MIEIRYRKTVPYSFEAVLSQYFDYEHIEHVHPNTLGTYKLVERLGNVIRYDQIWPRKFLRRRTSRVRQEFFPPNRIHFVFERGLYKGVQVHTLLAEAPEGTLIEETHTLPRLPNWAWLARWVEKAALLRIDRIWEEDLSVDICRDGWPGVPEGIPKVKVSVSAVSDYPKSNLMRGNEVPDQGCSVVVDCENEEVAVFNVAGELFGLTNQCPHAGGPLALGKVSHGCVACPWHGAKFSLKSGEALSGPTKSSVRRFRVVEGNGRIDLLEELN